MGTKAKKVVDAIAPPALSDGYRTNFDTMLRAAANADLALVSCIRKSDNAPVAMAAAIRWDAEDKQWHLTPLAVMCEGNPYDDYSTVPEAMQPPKKAAKKKAARS